MPSLQLLITDRQIGSRSASKFCASACSETQQDTSGKESPSWRALRCTACNLRVTLKSQESKIKQLPCSYENVREEKLVRRRTGRPAEGEPPDGAAKMQADAEPSQQTGHKGREVVDAFKDYLIPGNLYNDLANRAKAKPCVLRRSFSYSQASAAAEGRSKKERHKSVLVTVGLQGKLQYEYQKPGPLGHMSPEYVSLIAVLCHQPIGENQDFMPCSAALMHVPVKGHAVSVPLRLPSDEMPASDFCVVIIVARECLDMKGIGIRHGSQLVPRLTGDRIFSLLKPRENVLYGCCSSLKQAKNEVALQAGTVRVHCAGTAANGCLPRETSAVTFVPCIPAGKPGILFQGRIRGADGINEPAACGTVYIRFFSRVNNKSYVVEIVTNFACPLCQLHNRNFLGLTQHLEASHDLFVYGHPDNVNALQVISVEPKDDIYSSTGHFQSLEANILKDPVNKEFSFFCAPSLRKNRVGQYSDSRKRALFPLPPFAAPPAKKARLTLLSSARNPDAAADLQDLHGYPAPVVRRRGRRAAAPAVPVLDPVEHYQRFYHARTAVQMKQQELVAIMADPKSAPDSDDEEDLEMWKDKSRRKLAPRNDLCQEEKAFMFNWNLHMRNHPVHADAQVPECCMNFSRINHGILSTNLAIRRVYTLHLVNLYEFGLLTPYHIDNCLKVVDDLIEETDPAN
ncbi:hypothetical protein WJX75_007086 [Coccomyxa subellipsoidea]|uniref:Polycomb protein VEFS-Box domain-containing protein n=1 Tax=Coccomyxa subellipsoidea TaxID=248742 RepID=A0ABR2YUC7_9CHLO